MDLERKNYPVLGEPVGPFVHAVRHGQTLYLSGLTAFGSAAQTAPIEQQAHAIFQQIRAIAEAEGAGLDGLIKVTAFVTDLGRIAELREALFEIYGTHLPASSLIQVAALFADDLKIEIEAIIALPAPSA